MRELEQEYGDRVTFTIVPAEVTAQSQDELAAFGFTELRHGLVAFSASGEPVVKIPGHQFGRDRIEEAIEAALAAS